MNTLADSPNKFLETSSPHAAMGWDDLLSLQVSLFFPHEMQFLLAWTAWGQARSVLDVGCGNGAYVSRLREFFPDKFYTGIDISPELISVAKRRHHDPTLLTADFFSYRPIDLSDLVIMRFIVQHLCDFPAILRQAATVLNTDGSLLIVEPDFRNSVNVPQTPQFEGLLRAFDDQSASEGRNRTRLNDLQDIIAKTPGWEIAEHVRLAVPHIGPFRNTDVLRMYLRWIDLIERTGQVPFPYEQVREELAIWSNRSNTFSRIGLHVFHVRRIEIGG